MGTVSLRVARSFLWLCAAGLLCVVSTARAAAAQDIEWTTRAKDGQVTVHLYLFWSMQCPHCLEARPQLIALAREHRWLNLHDLELSQSAAHQQRFADMAQAVGEPAQAVPTLMFCGRMQTGWDSSPAAQQALLGQLQACRDGDGQRLGERPVAPPITLPMLGNLNPDQWSLPMLTVLIAVLDSFNPCAFFVLLFLLSLLVHQHDRRRMLLIGLIFVTLSGVMYFAFMAAWLNLFRLLGNLSWVTLVAGGMALLVGLINIKDLFAFKQGVSLSISDSGRSRIAGRARRLLNIGNMPTLIATTAVLAVAANFYELLCTAGFPMVFARILTLHDVGTVASYGYLALYNLVYVLPLLVIVLMFVRTMGARKLSEREGRVLKLLSGLMMSGLGFMLLLRPELLSSIGMAFVLVATALALTWLGARLTRH